MRRFKPYGFAPLTNRQLDRASNDPAFGSSPGLAFSDEESTMSPEPMTTLMAGKTFIVPLSANRCDDYVFLYGFLAAQAFGRCTAGIALETPSEAVFFNKWSRRIEWL